MIELTPENLDVPPTRLKVIGLGSAGGNMLDRIVLDGLVEGELVAVNTDLQALAGSVAPRKIQIGQQGTRGLGAGGDPEVGAAAAQEALDEISAEISGSNVVVLLAGLGGGTGSGALPVLAEAARAQDALVIVVATLPFAFEGNRRRAQALEALSAVDGFADLLICFENDRMGELVSARAGIREAFAVVDHTLAEAVRTLSAVARGRGLLRAGLDEISAAFTGTGLRALFGWGEASGDNRVHEAVEAALKSPLLERGRQLREAQAVVIQLAGGHDLTLNEVQVAMDEVRRQLPEKASLYCGLTVDPALGAQLRLTILASTYAGVAAAEPAPPPPAPAKVKLPPAPAPSYRIQAPRVPITPRPRPVEEPLEISVEMPASVEVAESAEPELEAEVEPELIPAAEAELEEEPIPAEAEAEAEPELEPEPEPEPARPTVRPRMRPLFAPMQANVRRSPDDPPALPKPPREEKQEQMLFEPVNRGRFEKSEPTIIDGQDLDVPTFMRRNVRLDR